RDLRLVCRALAASQCARKRAAHGVNAMLAPLLADAAARSAAGDTAGAIAAYQAALAQVPQRAELWNNVAVLEAQRGGIDAALDAIAQAARLQPEWAEPWQLQGRLLFAQHRFDE